MQADGGRVPEKKHGVASTRPPSTGSAPHKITHAVDKMSHSTTTANPVDLQASVFGRPTSSLSSMTVPIRLDALSYLLNNALMGAYRMTPQMPFYGSQFAMPICHNSTQLYSSQMGQTAQTGCAGHGCCPAHYTAPVCPTSQLCPNQPQIYPGNTCPDPSKWPGRAAGIQNETTVLYPPEVQRDPNASSWSTNSGWCTQSSANASGIETNTWNGKPAEATVERQNTNFVQPKSSFSGNSDRQNSSPKTSFGNSSQRSFGSWKDNQRGNSWTGRQSRNFDRPMGRSNDNFNSGSWRGNLRDQNRDSTFAGRSSSYDFGNRKRNQDEMSWSQDDGQGSKQGRWSGGRGRGGGRGSWQQRSGGSPSQSEVGSFGDRFKSSATVTSNSGQTASFTKNDNSNEDWETDYKPEKPQQPSVSTPRWSLTVDKRPAYPNSRITAKSNNGLSSSFSKKDDSSEDWETDYKAEQLSASASKGPCAVDQKPKDLKPHLTNCIIEDMDVAFEAIKSATTDEDRKSSKNVDIAKESLKEKTAFAEEKRNTNESDQLNDSEKGIFEKFMEPLFSDMGPKNDSICQATSAELEEGEFDDSTEKLDTEHPHMESTSVAQAMVFRFCSPPIPCATETCFEEEAVRSESVDTDNKVINKSAVSEVFDLPNEFKQQNAVSEVVRTHHTFPLTSPIPEAFAAQKELPNTLTISEAVDIQKECPRVSEVSGAVDMLKEFSNKSAISETVDRMKELPSKSAIVAAVDTQKEFPETSAVPETVHTQECPHKSPLADTVDKKKEFPKESGISEAVDTQTAFPHTSVVSEAVDIQKECPRVSEVSEAVNMQKEFTQKSAVSGAFETQNKFPNESAISEAIDTHKPLPNEETQINPRT